MDETPRIIYQLGNATKKINRCLKDKCYLAEPNQDNKLRYMSQRNVVTEGCLQQVCDKTQRMSIKLKQIRTLLGYKQNLPHRKFELKKCPSVTQDEKGINLKNFVLQRRKKNEIVKLTETKKDQPKKQIKTLLNQDPGLQQYTNASLTFINSFLPHQTLLHYQAGRQRKAFSQNKKKQMLKQPALLKEKQQMQRHLLENPQRKAQIKVTQYIKRKINYSLIVPKRQIDSHVLDMNTVTNQKTQTTRYLTMYIDSPREPHKNQKDSLDPRKDPFVFVNGKALQYSSKNKSKSKERKSCSVSDSAQLESNQEIKRGF